MAGRLGRPSWHYPSSVGTVVPSSQGGCLRSTRRLIAIDGGGRSSRPFDQSPAVLAVPEAGSRRGDRMHDSVGQPQPQRSVGLDVDLGRGAPEPCLLYTSDAADDLLCVDLGGRRIIKKK